VGQVGAARPAALGEVIFGALGDIHGNFAALARIIERHPEIPFWLCVGDVANAAGEYPAPAAPVYFIKGNNENFDAIAANDFAPHLHFITNAQALRVGDVSVAGLGGTFAPTWYQTAAAALPHPKKGSARATQLADKRRHFVREEVDACRSMQGIDLLLTHEAPTPFWVELPSSSGSARRWRRDVGKRPITDVADALQPRLHLFGHHHTHASFTRAGVPTVCADRVNRSYLLVDSSTFEWELRTTDGA
jgi:Icc-related predicted phosphoesterase